MNDAKNNVANVASVAEYAKMDSSMGNRTNDVANIANVVSVAGDAKGTSLADVAGQSIRGIGVPPIRRELNRSPLEAADEDRNRLGANDFSQAVLRDANVYATKLTNLDGFPE